MAEGNSVENGEGEVTVESNCATCGMRMKAQENPKSWSARLWRFHTKFCPGWKAYKRELAEKGLPEPTV